MAGKKENKEVATFDEASGDERNRLGTEVEAAAAGSSKKKRHSKRELEEELKNAETKAAEYRNDLVRLQAEFENFKKRQAKEKAESQWSAREKILLEFLPVLDNLERAVDHGSYKSSKDKLLQGVQMVLKQLSEAFAQFGLEPIEARGAPFDPHFHEAMSTLETDGDPPDGTVVAVYQKGYLLKGRVLRPALVGVAKLVDEKEEERPA